MSEPLTAERFEDFVETYTQNHAQLVATLEDHTKRLERIENILWDGHRMEEIERRLIKIAERTGNADLATPITRPIGS
jgi:hypothetical protein